MKIKVFGLITLLLTQTVFAQTPTPAPAPNDVTTPLHRLQPNYPTPYGIPKVDEVTAHLNRVHAYLDGVTPTGFINSNTSEPVLDLTKLDQNTILSRGDF